MLETDIARWRARVTAGAAAGETDGRENRLRREVAKLAGAGLSEKEAFLVAVERLAHDDRLTAEFGREHSDRRWKELAARGGAPEQWRGTATRMAVFAAAAAVVIQIARLAAGMPADAAPWFLRNLGLFLLVPLLGYLLWSMELPRRRTLALGGAVAVLAVVINVFPFPPASDTGLLVAIHLPVVLWFAVAAAYLGDDLRSPAQRMEFLRFAGEWFVYYVLIALGGAVLLGLTGLVLAPIAPGSIPEVVSWVLPSGAAAAVVVAAWLVEAENRVMEEIMPVLSAIFTPLFAVMLIASAVVYASAGLGREFDRDLLIVFDVLLLVVLGLVIYGLAARSRLQRVGVLDVVRFTAVAAALVLDLLVVGSMLARIGEFGFTPNRVAALGLNLLLVASLAGTAWLGGRMLAGRAPALRLEHWQTAYLPVFGLWAVFVVVALPPIFGFV